MRFFTTLISTGLLLFPIMQAIAQSGISPLYAKIVFHFEEGYNDFRPVLNAEGTIVIFERTVHGTTTLYRGDLGSNKSEQFMDIPSTRPDWCWDRTGGLPPRIGPIAFSNDDGIHVVKPDGSGHHTLDKTKGMVYPSWYPNCSYLAVDVSENAQVPGKKQFTAKIDASTGKVVDGPLAADFVWAGFPSVNQVFPALVAFAGQNNQGANYYDQDLNYTWVTNRRTYPMDRKAPSTPGFLQRFQARAGWWSPDSRWFAFESNRACSNLSGETYAIFIQDAAGLFPAKQVTSCDWNAQHPKWYPASGPGVEPKLIAAVAAANAKKFNVATIYVGPFLR
jgi:hypothetical protein